jgi:hypothetical protein
MHQFEKEFLGKLWYEHFKIFLWSSDSNCLTVFVDFAKKQEARYEEDLIQLKGYKIAVDADLLLSKVKECSVLKSI